MKLNYVAVYDWMRKLDLTAEEVYTFGGIYDATIFTGGVGFSGSLEKLAMFLLIDLDEIKSVEKNLISLEAKNYIKVVRGKGNSITRVYSIIDKPNVYDKNFRPWWLSRKAN